MQKEAFLKSTKPLPGLLEHIAQELGADFAYLYRVEEPAGSAELVARTGVVAPPASERHGHGAIPDANRIVVGASAWSDPRLFPFPDIAVDRIESAALIPVDAPFGRAVLAIGRRQPRSFDPCHVALFELISLGLSAILCSLRLSEELAELRAELERTREKLASRKAIERAKGIIQARDACSEDEAYGHLRRLSRTTREPMSEIARRVIERSGAIVVEHEELIA
jgi:hypothetical protein